MKKVDIIIMLGNVQVPITSMHKKKFLRHRAKLEKQYGTKLFLFRKLTRSRSLFLNKVKKLTLNQGKEKWK